MNCRESIAPFLVLTCGNPSRGDDALGPALHALLERHKLETRELSNVDLLTDFQLQIEHAVDLEQREAVLFVDAGVRCSAPFELSKLTALRDDSFTTHAMSPASVLHVFQKVHSTVPPPSFLLTIRAYQFGLGQDMSERAVSNLQQSFRYVVNNHWLEEARLV